MDANKENVPLSRNASCLFTCRIGVASVNHPVKNFHHAEGNSNKEHGNQFQVGCDEF